MRIPIPVPYATLALCVACSAPTLSPRSADGVVTAIVSYVQAREDSGWVADSAGYCVGIRLRSDRTYYSDPSRDALDRLAKARSPVWPYSACADQTADGVMYHLPSHTRTVLSVFILMPSLRREGTSLSVRADWHTRRRGDCASAAGRFFFSVGHDAWIVDSAHVVQLCA